MRTGISPRLIFQDGFTLTELAVVLAIVALLIGGLLMPLAEQDNMRRTQETRKILSDASEALLGFAAAQGRLPCPATLGSGGQEGFAAGGGPANGNCSNFFDGFLPAAALGISPVDANGLARDGWNRPIRYAIYPDTVSGIGNPFTRTDGIKDATMSSLASRTALSVCATSTDITSGSCATTAKLTDKAPAVLFSTGRNAPTGGVGNDEVANLNGDAVFVGHEPTPSTAANGEFDDLVVWLSPNILYNRMIAAGRLP
jgi:prepilin-type N-terminal cleavage/methylation domain-containing protein